MRLSLSLIQFFLGRPVCLETAEKTLSNLGIEVDAVFPAEKTEIAALELSLTPNLGHALSALGIARELSAALQIPLIDEKVSFSENHGAPIQKKVQLSTIDGKACPRYMGRCIENVKIKPSPDWLQKELRAAGLQPICNVVDVTNFILIKRGQPLHAFDLDQIDGKSIRVATSDDPQQFLGLDGVERTVPPGALWIWDAKKPIALAGILGGQNSSVHEGTQNIFLEAAFFDPVAVRKTSKATALRTDSAIRFEKGVDPNGVLSALNEAAHLIAELGEGSIAHGVLEKTAFSFEEKQIPFRFSQIRRLIGISLSQTEVISLFTRLHFSVKTVGEDQLLVKIPTYRFDINEEIDLIEEIIRLYGYNHIPKTSPVYRCGQIPHDPMYLFEKEIRKRCIGLGLQELLTADLISPKLATLAIESLRPGVEMLKTIHAKTEEYSILRPSLLPGLLQVVRYNLDQKNENLSGFELGRIHFQQNRQNVELSMLAFILTGQTGPLHWGRKPQEVDFYTLKGILENLLEGLKIKSVELVPSSHISLHPKRQMDLTFQGQIIGSFGEIHPSLLAKSDIKPRVLFAEIHLESLLKIYHPHSRYAAIAQLPASQRDWTIQIPTSTFVATVLQKIHMQASSVLEKVELIDLYEKEGSNTRNVTFRFTYRDPIQTLSFERVEAEHKKIIDPVIKLLDK